MKYSIIIAAALLVGCGQQQESNQVGTTPARKPQAQQIPTPPPVPSEDPKPDPTPVPDRPKGLFTRLCEDPSYQGPGRTIIERFTSRGRSCSEVDRIFSETDSLYFSDHGISDGYPISEWTAVKMFTNFDNPLSDFSFTEQWTQLEDFANFTKHAIDVELLPQHDRMRDFVSIGAPIGLGSLVSKIPNIENLTIQVSYPEKGAVKKMAELGKLRYLDIAVSQLSYHDLLALCSLDGIEVLGVTASELEDTEFLKECGSKLNVTTLDLSYNMLQSIDGVQRLPRLQKLTIKTTFSFLDDITPLHDAWNLEELELQGVPRNELNCPRDKELPEGVLKFCFG